MQYGAFTSLAKYKNRPSALQHSIRCPGLRGAVKTRIAQAMHHKTEEVCFKSTCLFLGVV
jgi:hypothetical protein